jgi:hypothetical protein
MEECGAFPRKDVEEFVSFKAKSLQATLKGQQARAQSAGPSLRNN